MLRRLRFAWVPCPCLYERGIVWGLVMGTRACARRPSALCATAVAAIVLSLVGGCVGPSAISGRQSLVPSARPYEADIPLPEGFRLVDRSSEDWAAGRRIRYLRHRYRGRADKYTVRRFYREQMPLVRWTAISDGNVNGRITMRFERAAESCTVTIEDETRRASRRVVIEVMVAPIPPIASQSKRMRR